MRQLLLICFLLFCCLAGQTQETTTSHTTYKLNSQQQQQLLWQSATGSDATFRLGETPVTMNWWQQVSKLPIRLNTSTGPILSTTPTVYSARQLLMNEGMLQLYRAQPQVKGRGVGLFGQGDPRFQHQR